MHHLPSVGPEHGDGRSPWDASRRTDLGQPPSGCRRGPVIAVPCLSRQRLSGHRAFARSGRPLPHLGVWLAAVVEGVPDRLLHLSQRAGFRTPEFQLPAVRAGPVRKRNQRAPGLHPAAGIGFQWGLPDIEDRQPTGGRDRGLERNAGNLPLICGIRGLRHFHLCGLGRIHRLQLGARPGPDLAGPDEHGPHGERGPRPGRQCG